MAGPKYFSKMKTDIKEHQTDPNEEKKIEYIGLPTWTEDSKRLFDTWTAFKFRARSYRYCASNCVNFKAGTKFTDESACFSNCLNANKAGMDLLQREKLNFNAALNDLTARGKDINEEYQI